MEAEPFRDGLALDNLNPPEITTFFKGVPRRADEHLSALQPRVPHDDFRSITDLLRSMGDQVADLIERLQSVGYPPASLEGGDRPEPEQVTEPQPGAGAEHLARLAADPGSQLSSDPSLSTELLGQLDRLRSGATQAGALLAGIPSRGWGSRPELLGWGRQAVGDVALSLRSLGELVAEANERAETADADSPTDGSAES